MQADKTKRLALIAKCVLAIGALVQMYALDDEISRSDSLDYLLFLFISLTILLTLFCLLAGVNYLRHKYPDESEYAVYDTIDCALWWTGTSLFYIGTLTLLAILGFIFVFIALGLWLEATRSIVQMRRNR